MSWCKQLTVVEGGVYCPLRARRFCIAHPVNLPCDAGCPGYDGIDLSVEQSCKPCDRIRGELNRHIPAAGDLLAKAIDIATFGHGAQLGHLIHGGPRLLLRWPHGLGDAVQGTIVLRHIRELHPEWKIDCAAKLGQRSAFDGLADRTFNLGDEPGDEHYEAAATLDWWDPEATYSDSPSTKAERCLREVFRIQPQERLCHYQINPSDRVRQLVASHAPSSPFALVHYQGNSATDNKTINEHAIREVVLAIAARGITPVILDWESPTRSGLVGVGGSKNYPAGHPIWGGEHGTGEAANIAALAALSTINVGIDSGPGHIFGATDTPTVIVWLRHHPVNYYCLAPNVLHVVGDDHRSTIFGDHDTGVRYFEQNYRHHVAHRDYRLELPEVIAKELL